MPRSTIGIVPIPCEIKKLAYEQQKPIAKSNPLGLSETEIQEKSRKKREAFENGCKLRHLSN